jgi:hypothetical protein
MLSLPDVRPLYLQAVQSGNAHQLMMYVQQQMEQVAQVLVGQSRGNGQMQVGQAGRMNARQQQQMFEFQMRANAQNAANMNMAINGGRFLS